MPKTLFINLLLFSVLLVVSNSILFVVLSYFPDRKWLIAPFALVHLFLIFFAFKLKTIENQKSDTSARAELEKSKATEKYISELQEYLAQQNKLNQSLKDSKEKFRHAAFHDALTDLPNRSLFIETLKFTLEKHKQTADYNFAVLFLNLNRFKTINDSLGHSNGDRLILNVSKRLSEIVREGDLVARFGGDEFGIILNNIQGIREAVNLAALIKERVAEPFSIAGKEVFSSISIGIAPGKKDYCEVEGIMRDADIAMYHAKKQGKGIEVFNSSMQTDAMKLLQLETDLRYAIERNEMCAYFQPIIELESLKLVGFESLIRWKHPEKGLIPPGDFIPVSEETNLIIPITLWMLRHSCEQLIEWQNQSPLNKNLFLSVNLSGKHFTETDLVSQVRKIVVETGIEPSCLKLEITESAVMENAETVILMLKELKEIGVQLSIDDFGTGYSSLSYLHRFPIDTIKIDRSFVSTMEEKSENGEIVRTIIALAKTLGMNIVAEGIETIHQLHQLRVLNCEYGQGYLFSIPIPAEEAEILLQDKTRLQRMLPGSFSTGKDAPQAPLEISTTQ